jgi:hypothetical protein
MKKRETKEGDERWVVKERGGGKRERERERERRESEMESCHMIG